MSWPLVKVGDVAEFIRNGLSINQSDSKEGLPITRIETIADREINLERCGYAGVNRGDSDEYLLNKGDILISHINSEKHLAKCAIFELEDIDLIHGMNLLCLRPAFGRVFPKYLFHCLSDDIFLRQIKKITKKSVNQASFTVPSFKELEIPLPPLEEQKRIAAILDKADAIRRKRQQAIKLADNFLRSVFLEMFGDPVTNPKGFKKVPITELAQVITGFPFKSNEYIGDSSDAVRLCRGTNTLTGYLDWSDTAYWPKNKLEKLEGYLIKPGDIILAMDRPWISSGLKVCVFPENQRETYLVQRVARLRSRRASYTDYIYSCIKSLAFERHCCPTETTVPHISPVELKNFEVLLPNSELIEKYHSVVSVINSSLKQMTKGNSISEDMFASLSQRAFSGKP